VQLCLFYIGLATLSALHSQAINDVSPPIPEWIENRRDLLPPINLGEFLLMKKSWESIQISDVEFNPPPRYWEGLEAIASMGEKAVEALVWLYVQEPPRLNPELGVRDEYLIRTVFLNDTTSVRWVLPLLRYRLQWMEGLLVRREYDRLLQLCDELGAIQGYLNIRGDEQDYRNVMDFISKLASANDALKKRLSALVGPDYDAAVDESRRKARRQQLFPYHEWAKLALTSRKGTAQHSDKTEAATTQGNKINLKPAPSPNGLEAKPTTATPSEEPTSSTPWSIIVVLIVAASGLLWLLVKKRQ
jgi:hypothetical protein